MINTNPKTYSIQKELHHFEYWNERFEMKAHFKSGEFTALRYYKGVPDEDTGYYNWEEIDKDTYLAKFEKVVRPGK